jgi:hypothetical protein
MILAGITYASIISQLPEDHGLSERNISEHCRRGHVPLDGCVAVSLNHIEIESITDIDSLIQPVADRVAKRISPALRLAEQVVQRAQVRLDEGDLDVTLKDAMAAATLLEKFAPPPLSDVEVTEDDMLDVIELVRTIWGSGSQEWMRFMFDLKEIPWGSQRAKQGRQGR